MTLPGGEDDWVLQARIRRSENMAVEVRQELGGSGFEQVGFEMLESKIDETALGRAVRARAPNRTRRPFAPVPLRARRLPLPTRSPSGTG